MKNRRTHSILLILLLLVLGVGIGAYLIKNSYQVRSLPENPVPFSEMQYTRPSPDRFNEKLAELEQLSQSKGNTKAILQVYDDLELELQMLSRESTLADLHHALDYTDPYYADETLYCSELATSIIDRLNSAMHDLFLSPAAEDLKKHFSQEVVEEYLSYEAMPEEYFTITSQEQELIQTYHTLYDALDTVSLNGEEMDLLDAYQLYLLHPERTDVYAAIERCVADRNAKLGDLYMQLVDIRDRIAELEGYDSYSDYAYKEIFDRDYTPDDSAVFHQQVKDHIVPLYSTLKEQVNLVSASITTMNPSSEEENLDLLAQYVPRVSPKLSDSLAYMRANGLYDISPSDTKITGAFTASIALERVPFLFMGGTNTFGDFGTLVHEFGHFSAMIYASDEYWTYSSSSLDLAEINSQGLEVLFDSFYPEILGTSSDAYRGYNMLNLLEAVVTGCLFDEFQDAAYNDPDMTLEELNALYLQLCEEYQLSEDPFELCIVYDWVLIPHSYVQPMYYISYATSAAPSLELMTIADQDWDKAVDIYMELLYTMGRTDFVDTLESCHLHDPFSEDYFSELAPKLAEHMQKLGTELEEDTLTNAA